MVETPVFGAPHRERRENNTATLNKTAAEFAPPRGTYFNGPPPIVPFSQTQQAGFKWGPPGSKASQNDQRGQGL